jgi:zinc protease
MKIPRSLFSIMLAIVLSPLTSGQVNLNNPVPFDPTIRTGKLENGLTYFIKSNKEPEKRASFYFIQNVGAILENDNENGLAHFLEHMAFNGTEHFPDKEIISSLEKHGVAFGKNINAYTGVDETIYNLSDVPVDAPGLLDTCLLIMYDWSDFVSLTGKEIDLERPVITEEWRTRRDASFRLMLQYYPILLKDSKYAIRDVIGDTSIIKHFNYKTIRDFYSEWYRPDLQAVAIVGDFDAGMIENKVKDLFSKLQAVSNPEPRPTFEVPFYKDTLFVLATDVEAPYTLVNIYIKQKGTDPSDKNLGYERQQIMIQLMNAMMRTRINELLQKGTPPFITGSIGYSELVRDVDILDIYATANKNEEDIALKAIYTEADRARRFGFTEGELKRAKANLLTNYENYYRQKDKISNDSYCNDIQNYFLSGEPMPSVDFEYEFAKEEVPAITTQEVSDFFRSLMQEENMVIVIEGLKGEGIVHLTGKQAKDILKDVRESDLTPYQDTTTGESLVNGELPGGKIVKTVRLNQFNAVEWTLSNNAKVVYRKADYEKDNVILVSYSLGGSSLYETDMLPSATLMPAIIGTYGLGDYDNITLQKMLAGKKASASVSLGQITEGINGSSTPKDFETMMQLLYLRFASPRFDTEAHNAIMTRYKAFLASMAKDPSKIIQDSVSLFLTNYNPRTVILNNETLEKVDLDKIRQIYTERFNNASGFTFFIVGNIGEDTVKTLVEKYIGSIKGGTGKETFIDRNVRPPEGKFSKDVRIPLTVPKATVLISHSEDFRYKPYNNVCLRVIAGILDLVYTEKVREEAGGTYGVSVNISSQLYPYQNATGLIMFECDPARVDSLKQIIYNEIDNLVKKGPGEENLEKTVSNLLKTREEAKLHNNFWSSVLFNYYYTGINVDNPENFENILKNLTVKDIRKIAKAFFSKADVADIVFRPDSSK